MIFFRYAREVTLESSYLFVTHSYDSVLHTSDVTQVSIAEQIQRSTFHDILQLNILKRKNLKKKKKKTTLHTSGMCLFSL